MTDPARTRSVLVIGDGTVGLAAAIALRRALPDAVVELVQLPPDPHGWIDRLGAASPAIHDFHRQIGLDAHLFVRRAHAEPVHLRHYRHAGGGETREASTATIPFVEGVPLHHVWLRGRAETGAASPDFAAMLLALREARGDDGGFGVRYDPLRYRDLLSEMATALNIVRHDAGDIRVSTSGGMIAKVEAAGNVLIADLYVDAAGPRSRLLGALGTGWRDWLTTTPAMALTIAPPGDGAPGEETLAWSGRALAWQTRRWRAAIAPAASAPATGRLMRSAGTNAVAIGEAAVRLPAMDGAGFGSALHDILRVIALLPRPGGAGSESAEYERRATIAHEALADWTCLGLAPAGATASAGLQEILAAFASRGRVVPRELDPIPPGAWLARLMALGPAPARVDPTALALSEAIVRSTIARAH